MKTRQIMVLAVLLGLWAAADARAFYNPETGRWLNRDPLGERGFRTATGTSLRTDKREPGLYAFVADNPINRVDSLGLRAEPPSGPADHCQDPCGDAKKRGLDKNIDGVADSGGVICCSGKKYACVWSTDNATNQKAKDTIAKCISAHENDHFDDIDCPKCWKRGFPTRPPFKKGKDRDAEECNAFTAELKCLQASISDCGGDTDCENQVTDAIQNAVDKINEHCFK
jgi:RHS repeat-associated protein